MYVLCSQQDPSVAAATEPPPSTEEYNPFAEQQAPKEPEVSKAV